MPKFQIGDPVILADGQEGHIVETANVFGQIAVKIDHDGLVVYTFEEDVQPRKGEEDA